MRVTHLLALLVALGLWGGSLVAGWRFPWEVTIRPAAPPVAPGPGSGLWLRAEVTTTYPHLEGLALGDAVQYDRYGTVAPTAGQVHCTRLEGGPDQALPGGGAVHVTPIGGRMTHEGSLMLTVEPAVPAECGAGAARPLVSAHPGRHAR